MKKNLTKKLVLKKQTITDLNEMEKNSILGGYVSANPNDACWTQLKACNNTGNTGGTNTGGNTKKCYTQALHCSLGLGCLA